MTLKRCFLRSDLRKTTGKAEKINQIKFKSKCICTAVQKSTAWRILKSINSVNLRDDRLTLQIFLKKYFVEILELVISEESLASN